MIVFNSFKQFFVSSLTPLLFVLFAGYAVDGYAAFEFVSTFGSSGSAGGQFSAPRGVAISQLGKIVITESGNHRVQVCTDQGVCTNFGNFGTLSGEFDRPRGVAVNSVDRLFIADRGNDRIESCAITGSCTDFGGSGTEVGKFESPRGVAIDPLDLIYITDTDHDRIQVCDDQGVCTAFGSTGSALGQFISPAGIAIDKQGKVVIADRGNNRIQICSVTGTNCTAFGSGGTGLGQFDQPAGIAVDSRDRIIVVDRFNDRIQVCTHQGSCTAFGSFGITDGLFDRPWGVAVDDEDRIIVADLGNDRIQIFAEPATPAVQITSFTASPISIEAGQSTMLSWSVSDATSCSALNGTSDWRAITPAAGGGNDTITIVGEGNYSFTLECTDGSNTVSANAAVTVTAPPPVVIIDTFTASPLSIEEGEVTTLSWTVNNATACTAMAGTSDWRAITPAAAGGTADITIATEGSYSFTLQCTDGINTVSANADVLVTVKPNTPPTRPGTLSASAVTSSSATVSWLASTDNEGNTITYQVDYRISGDVLWTSGGSTIATSLPLSGLVADKFYDVRVTPNDGIDDGTSRETLGLFKTDAANTAPTQPGTLSASAVTSDSATVSWNASTDNENDTITYRVEYRRNGDTLWTNTGSTTATSLPLSGLGANQSYDVRVTPNDGSVDGSSRTTLKLFKTSIDLDAIFKDGFEG